jgi:hypothetical protein
MPIARLLFRRELDNRLLHGLAVPLSIWQLALQSRQNPKVTD